MLFVTALVLSLAFAVFILAILRISGRVSYLLALYLLAACPVILIFEILGLAHQLNNRMLFVNVQALLFLGVFFVWLKRGQPALFAPFLAEVKSLRFERVGASIRRHPWLWLLALAVDLAYAINAYIILVVPPNNNDSLYLHMARVAKWLQTGSFLPYAAQNAWQLYYPYNAQALIHWTVLLWGSDQLSGFIQFSASLVTMLAVYGFARLLRFSRPQGVFAALLWATFPQVFFQSTSTQNDLVPAAFLAAGVYFLLQGLRASQGFPLRDLTMACLGVSLALGAKQTVFFVLPGLLIVLVLLARRRWKSLAPRLLKLAPIGLAVFILFGAGMYIQNVVVYGNPMGDPATVSGVSRLTFVGSPGQTAPPSVAGTNGPALRALWINLNRIGYQFIDTTGLPPFVEGYLFRGKAHLARYVYGQIAHLPLETSEAVNPATLIGFDFFRRPLFGEDEAWFGIFAPLLLGPAGLALLIRRRLRDPLPLCLWLLAGSFTLFELLLRPGWDVYLCRNFILAMVFIAPFAAAVYRRGWMWKTLIAVVTLLSIYSLSVCLLDNPAKPLIGQRAVWILSRADKLTLQSFQFRDPARLAERSVPADANLAMPSWLWEYPFYDSSLRRRLLLQTEAGQLVDLDHLRGQHAQYILLQPEFFDQPIPTGLQPVDVEGSWTLFTVNP